MVNGLLKARFRGLRNEGCAGLEQTQNGPRFWRGPFAWFGLLLERSAAEGRQDRLRRAVGDRQRLDAELLLDLQRLEAGRFLVHVGIDELADTAVDGVHQALREG